MTEARFKVLLLLGLVASTTVAIWAWRTAVRPEGWICWLIWPSMLLHQCEEHVFTEPLLGRRFAFLDWVRSVGYDITVGRAFLLNVGVGWTLALASGLIGPHFMYVPLFVAVVEGVNGFWHLSVTALRQSWSPGTLTGTVLAAPLAFLLMHHELSRGAIEPWAAYGLLLAACLSHHRFLGSLPRVREA
jgi:hypothetical protein